MRFNIQRMPVNHDYKFHVTAFMPSIDQSHPKTITLQFGDDIKETSWPRSLGESIIIMQEVFDKLINETGSILGARDICYVDLPVMLIVCNDKTYIKL